MSMNINGIIINTEEELETTIINMDDSSKIGLRMLFHETTPPSVYPTHLEENYKVEEYSDGIIQKVTWYQDKDISDNLTHRAREVTYVYTSSDTPKQITDIIYDIDGNIIDTIITKYYTEDNKVYTEVEHV